MVDIRNALLGLHKALIVAEQLTFERIYGRVDSTGQLLQLVMNDPWFTWLHPLSNMVVRIDELLDDDEELTVEDVAVLMTEIRGLIRPSESGDGFQSRAIAVRADDDGDARAHQGQHDAPKDAPVPAAVHHRRLDQFVRQGVEEAPQDEDRERERIGHVDGHQAPVGVEPTEVAHQEEERDDHEQVREHHPAQK